MKSRVSVVFKAQTKPLENGKMEKKKEATEIKFKKGSPMSEREADGGAPNPNFNLSRGYDVEALPNSEEKTSATYKLSIDTRLAWLDPERKEKNGFIPYPNKVGAKGYLKWLNKILVAGGRYTMQARYKNGGGHIVHIRMGVENKAEIYDHQSGEIFTDSKWIKTRTNEVYSNDKYRWGKNGEYTSPLEAWFSIIKFTENGSWKGPELLRVDDKNFNVEMINNILKEREE